MSGSNRTVAILTALRLEYDAVLRQLTDATEQRAHGRHFHEGRIGQNPVVVHCLHGMGSVTASTVTTQIIERWAPVGIVLVGIAGGKKKSDEWSRMLGDILVADQTIDIESGAQTAGGLEYRPHVYRSAARWVNAAQQMKGEEWLSRIIVNRPDGSSGRVIPRLHVGPVASAQAVIKHGSHLQAVGQFFTNLLGVEMEGVGAAHAAFNREVPVDFVLIKAICDWADEGKNDAWQPYAADAAAAFASALIKRVMSARTIDSGTPKSADDGRTGGPLQRIPGQWKILLQQRLHTSWEELADFLEIPLHEKASLESGQQARRIVEWLESRGRQNELLPALHAIGRGDLAEILSPNP